MSVCASRGQARTAASGLPTTPSGEGQACGSSPTATRVCARKRVFTLGRVLRQTLGGTRTVPVPLPATNVAQRPHFLEMALGGKKLREWARCPFGSDLGGRAAGAVRADRAGCGPRTSRGRAAQRPAAGHGADQRHTWRQSCWPAHRPPCRATSAPWARCPTSCRLSASTSRWPAAGMTRSVTPCRYRTSGPHQTATSAPACSQWATGCDVCKPCLPAASSNSLPETRPGRSKARQGAQFAPASCGSGLQRQAAGWTRWPAWALCGKAIRLRRRRSKNASAHL